jgi:hypothetical protein
MKSSKGNSGVKMEIDGEADRERGGFLHLDPSTIIRLLSLFGALADKADRMILYLHCHFGYS